MKSRRVPIVVGVLLALTSAYMLVEGWTESGEVRYAALVTFVCGIVLAMLEARTRNE
jgi:hypothetical protein